VLELFSKQQTRGREGFGYIALDENWNMLGVHRAKYEFEIRKMLNAEKAPIILFHHRMPTSTKNTLGTTHPFFVSHDELEYDYYWAHNGGISNKEELKKKHNEEGYDYQSEFMEHTYAMYNNGVTESLSSGSTHYNDSECLAIEMSKYSEGLTDEVGIKGAAAFWGIRLKKGTNEVVSFFYGKNAGRDLCITNQKKYHGITSITGREVDELKLFSLDKGDPQLYEQDLKMDEYVTRRPVGFQQTQGRQLPLLENREIKSAYESMQAYNLLENKHYSYSEALDTGIPLSEFFSVEEVTLEGKSVRLWIPNKFSGQVDDRKMASFIIPPTEDELGFPIKPQSGLDKKGEDLLEELCTKYIKIEADIDLLEEFYQDNKIPDHEYQKQGRRLESESQRYEEKIYTSGANEAYIEELIDTCRQLESYNRSYSVDQDMEWVQTA